MPSPERDEVSLHVDAPPEVLYALVADVTNMGRWSPECTGGRWIGRTRGPAPGARFLGFNRRGLIRWATVNTVVTADPGREFAFETRQSGTRWGYRFEPAGDGTVVTEWREPFRDRPLAARLTARFLLGGVESHDVEMREGMRRTLERIRSVAET
jgi:hypothetical protein